MRHWMQHIWEYFTCRRYTELASKSLEQPLQGRERFGFYLHHAICTFCRRSRRQFELLEKASKRLVEERGLYSSSHQHLSDEAKYRMKQALSQRAE